MLSPRLGYETYSYEPDSADEDQVPTSSDSEEAPEGVPLLQQAGRAASGPKVGPGLLTPTGSRPDSVSPCADMDFILLCVIAITMPGIPGNKGRICKRITEDTPTHTAPMPCTSFALLLSLQAGKSTENGPVAMEEGDEDEDDSGECELDTTSWAWHCTGDTGIMFGCMLLGIALHECALRVWCCVALPRNGHALLTDKEQRVNSSLLNSMACARQMEMEMHYLGR